MLYVFILIVLQFKINILLFLKNVKLIDYVYQLQLKQTVVLLEYNKLN